MEKLSGAPAKEQEKQSKNAKTHTSPSQRGLKRKRCHSNETSLAKAVEEELEEVVMGKRRHIRQLSVSSKTIANHVMKVTVQGSESDPLNLEGASGMVEIEEECSTCAPSPVFCDGGQPSPLPPHLLRDPLNLEGRVPEPSGPGRPGKTGAGFHRRRGRRKTMSRTEEREEGGVAGRRVHKKKASVSDGSSNNAGPAFHPPTFTPKGTKYCYGNYDMYYGYRCGGGASGGADPRVALLKREWFEGKDCLDIGSNTGQVTLAVAQRYSPRRIVGVDIDQKLVRIANKNLFRHHVPLVAPDGRPFPSSITHTASLSLFMKSRGSSLNSAQPFPLNVEFIQENYVPESEEGVSSTRPHYDVILALSITKWVHLNWGDAGLRRMFQKIYQHLRPGGKLILEPQPFSSYTRKKKLTATIYKNYHSIQFLPDQFHAYLMSKEVGFCTHKFIGVPHHKSAGFRRPLHMYIKSDLCQVTTSDNSSREGDKVETMGEREDKDGGENEKRVDSMEEGGKGGEKMEERKEEGEGEEESMAVSEVVLEEKERGTEDKEHKMGDNDVVLTEPLQNSCCLVPK